MGVVYRAQQLKPRRDVALKVLHPNHLRSEGFRQRFEREAELLGRLVHPGIARIYQAGTEMVGDRAVPYIAMELVDGLPLGEFLSHTPLETEEKLKLLACIADAVHAAHQKAVVHRDLKPGNILVTRSGEPKVLDFGIASSTSSDLDETLRTAAHDLLGTVAYMSPEQACCEAGQVDSRTDIYALGLIGYEVLAGQPAFELAGDDLQRLLKRVQLGEPTPLGRINPALRGDLEAIIAKACRQDPKDRYESAAALAADVRRYLEGLPVTARVSSAGYELQKFVRRNRVAVGSAALVVLALVGGAVTATIGFLKARRSATLASDRATELEQVVAFQEGRLNHVDVEGMGIDLRRGLIESVRDTAQLGVGSQDAAERVAQLERLIDGADFAGLAVDSLREQVFTPTLEAIEEEFARRPLLRAKLLHSFGATLRDIGLLQDAASPQRKAMELRASLLGEDHPDTLASTHELSESLAMRNELDEARQLQERALSGRQSVLGAEDPDTLDSMGGLALILCDAGEAERARELQERVLSGTRKMYGEENAQTAVAKSNLAHSLYAMGDWPGALDLFEEAYQTLCRVEGESGAKTILIAGNLAQALAAVGERDRAREVQEFVFDSMLRSHGMEHPITLSAMSNMASTIGVMGDNKQALELQRKVFELRRKLHGEGHLETLRAKNNLASNLSVGGDLDEAVVLHAEVVDVALLRLTSDHPLTLTAMNSLAQVLRAQGETEQALKLYREVLETRERVLGSNNPLTLQTKSGLAGALSDQRTRADLMAARELQVEVLETRRTLDPEHPHTLICMNNLARTQHALGEVDLARDLVSEALEIARRRLGEAVAVRVHLERFAGELGL